MATEATRRPLGLHFLDRENSGADYLLGALKEGQDHTRFPPNKSTIKALRSLSNLGSLKSVPEVDDSLTSFAKHYFWNEKFQVTIEKPTSTPEEGVERYKHIHSLSKDLADEATPIVKTIISEINLSNESRKIKCVDVGGLAGGVKYVHGHMFLKFARDTERKLYGGDEYAAKAAGHELKSMNAIISTNQRTLHIPLTCIINYRGHRMIVMALLPIDEKSLMYGSRNAAKTIKTNSDLDRLLERVAGFLNLKAHQVQERGGDKEVKVVHTAVDIECHRGYDGRYYLLDLARLLPPEYPDSNTPGCYLYRILRAEFVKRYRVPLSSDACGFGLERENNDDIRDASAHLLKVTLPLLVKELKAAYSPIILEDRYSYDEERIKKLFHEQGVNLRFLAMILHMLSLPQSKSVGDMLDVSVTRKLSSPPPPPPLEPLLLSPPPAGLPIYDSSRSLTDYGATIGAVPDMEDSGEWHPQAVQEEIPSPLSQEQEKRVVDAIIGDIAVEIGARGFRSIVNTQMRNSGGSDVAIHELAAEQISFYVGTGRDFWEKNVKETLSRKFVSCLWRHEQYQRKLDRFLFKDNHIEKLIKEHMFNLMRRIQGLTGIIFKSSTYDKMQEPGFFNNDTPICPEHIKEVTATEKHLHVMPFVEVLAQESQYEQAEIYFQKELETRRALGNDHPQVARLLAHMAELYTTYPGKNEHAVECFEEAIRILRAKMGATDLEVVHMQEQLANFKNKTARYGEAEVLLREILQTKQKLLQPDDNEIAITYDNLAWALQNLGRYHEAHSYYEKAIAIHEKQDLGTSSEVLARTLNNMGTLLHVMGQTEEAIRFATRALVVLEESRGEFHSEVAVALENLAKLQAAKGDLLSAEKGYNRALEIKQKALGLANFGVAVTLDNMGQFFASQGMHSRAELMFNDALKIYRGAGDEMSTGGGITLYNLGKLYTQRKNKTLAVEKLKEAVEVFRKNLGTTHHYFENAQKALNEARENQLAKSASRLSGLSGRLPPFSSSFNQPVPPEWQQILRRAGVMRKDFANPQYARMIYRFIEELTPKDRTHEAAITSPKDLLIPLRLHSLPNPAAGQPRTFKFRVQKLLRRGWFKVSKVVSVTLATVRARRNSIHGAHADAQTIAPDVLLQADVTPHLGGRLRAITAPPGSLTKSTLNLLFEMKQKEIEKERLAENRDNGKNTKRKSTSNIKLFSADKEEDGEKGKKSKRSSKRQSKSSKMKEFEKYVTNTLNQLLEENSQPRRKLSEDGVSQQTAAGGVAEPHESQQETLPDISHLTGRDKDNLAQLLADCMRRLRAQSDSVGNAHVDDWVE